MRTNAIIRICIWSVVALLLIAALALLLLGNTSFKWPTVDWSVGFFTTHTYDNSAAYTVGNADIDQPIHAIDMEWINGSVDVIAYDGDTLRVREHNPSNDTDMQLHWLVKNETLYIQPCASKWFFGLVTWGDKDVTLEIPRAMLASFTMLEIESVSAPVTINDITTNALKIETVSGAITVNNTMAEVADLNSVSGNMFTDGTTVSDVDLEVVSGTVELTGSFRHLNTESVSGNITIRDAIEPASFEFDTVSGDVTLISPINEGYTLSLETVSGKLKCDIPFTKRGSLYVFGDGVGDYEGNTISGDIHIIQADELPSLDFEMPGTENPIILPEDTYQ